MTEYGKKWIGKTLGSGPCGLRAISLLLVVLWGTGCDAIGANPAMQQRQPMELRGHWMGLGLAATDSSSARQLGVPPEMSGVLVADVPQGADPRGLRSSLAPGDVIVAVDGQAVSDLTNLYTLSADFDVARSFPLQIVRAGQPVTVMVPAPNAFAAGRPATPVTADTAGTPGGLATPAAAASPAAATLFCPADGLHWTPAQVQPSFTCPRCGGPLTR